MQSMAAFYDPEPVDACHSEIAQGNGSSQVRSQAEALQGHNTQSISWSVSTKAADKATIPQDHDLRVVLSFPGTAQASPLDHPGRVWTLGGSSRWKASYWNKAGTMPSQKPPCEPKKPSSTISHLSSDIPPAQKELF